MSSVFKDIGKVFSAVWDFIRPVVEVVAIAAAAYFTVGLALSAFPATAGFAAALPGFASTGGVAGEGVFSSLAGSIGMGGGLQAGAAADIGASTVAGAAGAATGATAFGADLPTAAAAGDAGAAGAAGATAGAAATPIAPFVGGAATDVGAVGAGATGGGGILSSIGSASLTDKLLLASVGTNLVSGLTAPSPTDIAAAKAGFYGSYYGMDSSGSKAPTPDLSVGPQVQPQSTATAGNAAPLPGINIPSVQPATQATPGFQGVQRAQLIPTVPQGVSPVPGTQGSSAVAGVTPLATPKLIPSPSSNA